MNEKFYFTGFYSKLMSDEKAEKIITSYEQNFFDLDLQKISNSEPTDSYTTYFIVSGGSELQTINYINKNHHPDYPVILVAHPSENSLPAAMEILAKVKSDNKKGKIVFFNEPKDLTAFDTLKANIHNIKIYNKLSNSLLGLIGNPSDWLVASSQDIKTISKIWKCKIDQSPLEELRELYHSENSSDQSYYLNDFKENAKNIVEPFDEEILNGIKVYSALKKLLTTKKLDACSVRCFDLVINDKTTGCFALSQLIDDGIISGCEGDLPSLIAMYWTKLFTGKTPWMANPSSIDVISSTVKLAHCTIARSLTESYDIRSHFESGLGIGIQGEIKQGSVTLVRLGGKELKSIWIAEGMLKWRGNSENLCRTQIDVVLENKEALIELLENPLGNHIVMIHGSHREKLLNWHKEFIQ